MSISRSQGGEGAVTANNARLVIAAVTAAVASAVAIAGSAAASVAARTTPAATPYASRAAPAPGLVQPVNTAAVLSAVPHARAGATSQRQTAWSGIPLHFEPSAAGAADPRFPFVARGAGYGIAVGAREALFALPARAANAAQPVKGSASGATPGDFIHVRLVGARSGGTVTGADPLAGHSNYYIGNDPGRWRTGVQHYGGVQVSGVYPGIDLVYRAAPRGLEYDFVVAPGADPRRVRLAFEGARGLRLDEAGNLVIRAAHGELVHHAPQLYQQIGAERRPVSGRFVLAGAREVRFAADGYDRSHALVIDPTIAFSTYIGGSAYPDASKTVATGGDTVVGVAVDSSGAAYVTGAAGSYDFIPGLNPQPGSLPGAPGSASGVAFAAKFSATGQLLYTTFLKGTNSPNGLNVAVGQAVAVDASGNAYVTGINTFSDFPNPPALQVANPGHACSASPSDGGDAFIAKLASGTGALVYAGCIGGSGYDQGLAIAVDPSGNAYVAGNTQSQDLPVNSAAMPPFQATNKSMPPGENVFIALVLPNGTLGLLTYFGGSVDDSVAGATFAAGSLYLTGNTTSPDFPTTGSAYQPGYGGDTTGGSGDAFVTRLTFGGAGLLLTYSTYLGGTGADFAEAIAVDATGAAYVTGGTTSPNFPTTQLSCASLTNSANCQLGTPGGQSAFVTKLNATGSDLVYSSYFGGTMGNDNGAGIGVDAAGNAHVLLNALSNNLPIPVTTPPAPQPTYGGGASDFYVAKIAPGGDGLAWATYFGGAGADDALGLAVAPSGSVYVVGSAPAGFPTSATLPAVVYQASNLSTAALKPNGVVAQLAVNATSIVITAPSTTTLNATLTPALSCQSCVVFVDNSATVYGPYNLNGGVAQLDTSLLASGQHSLVAEYSGDAANGASASAAYPLSTGPGSSPGSVSIPAGGGGGCMAGRADGTVDITLLTLLTGALGVLIRRRRAPSGGSLDTISRGDESTSERCR